jgi:hypothetical protein
MMSKQSKSRAASFGSFVLQGSNGVKCDALLVGGCALLVSLSARCVVACTLCCSRTGVLFTTLFCHPECVIKVLLCYARPAGVGCMSCVCSAVCKWS